MKRMFSCAMLCALSHSTMLCAAAQMVDAMYVGNSGDDSITIIDVATAEVLRTIALPNAGTPRGLAWGGTAGMYVTFTDAALPPQSGVYVINPETFSFSLVSGAFNEPISLGFAGGTGLFVCNTGNSVVSVIDTTTNAVVGEIQAPTATDLTDIAWDGRIFLYVGSLGTSPPLSYLSVIDPSTSTLLPLFSLPYGYRSLGSDGRTGMYWSNTLDEEVAVVNTDTLDVEATIVVPFGAGALAWDGTTGMYVTSSHLVGDERIVNVIDIDTLAIGATVDVGAPPSNLAWNGATGMYCVSNVSNQVIIIDTQTISVLNSIAVGNAPFPIALGSANRSAFPQITKEPLVIVVDTTAADAHMQVSVHSSDGIVQGAPVVLVAGKPIADVGLNASLALLLGECGAVEIDFLNSTLNQSGQANADIAVDQQEDLTAVAVTIQCSN